MNGPISRADAEHYNWGAGCDGWHLVRTDSLSVIEERMPSGTAEVRHRHRHARQFFYVLEGVLTIARDDSVETLTVAHGLEVAPGVIHEVRNESGSDVRFIVVSQPPSHGDRETVLRSGEDGRP
jgi:mannose-6-phosphate isomerase-like protein (cupin superfamily)